MNHRLPRVVLAVTLLFSCVLPRISLAQTAIGYTVGAWGSNSEEQTTVPLAAQSGVTAIAAGGSHTVLLVITAPPRITTRPMNQVVNAWQSASFTVGATGYPLKYQWRKDGVDLAGATSAHYSLPFAHTHHAGNYTVVVSNSAGSVTSAPPAVLKVSEVPGTVVVWGWNWYGQPTVPVAAQSGVTAISAGTFHTVALKNDGSVVAWGWADPVPVAAQSGVTAIAAGNRHTVALKYGGTVVAWGWDSYGQVTGTPAPGGLSPAVASPVTLGGQVLRRVTALAVGPDHTVALVGGVPLLPSLKARSNDNELILSWPTSAPGFTLQSTLDLTPPVTWLDSTGVPTVIGAHFTLTNAPSGATRFYRLRNL